jgi:hypothetical protein
MYISRKVVELPAQVCGEYSRDQQKTLQIPYETRVFLLPTKTNTTLTISSTAIIRPPMIQPTEEFVVLEVDVDAVAVAVAAVVVVTLSES